MKCNTIFISSLCYQLQLSSDGGDRMGAKSNPPKKIPRASNKTPKIPGPNINPQKILCRISKARFGCTLFRGYGVTNLQIVLSGGGGGGGGEKIMIFFFTPPPPPQKKKSLLTCKSIHPKEYSPSFPTQKNPGIENFKPKLTRDHLS